LLGGELPELPELPGYEYAGRVQAARRGLCRAVEPRCAVNVSNFLNFLDFWGARTDTDNHCRLLMIAYKHIGDRI
jgi:hypothetical protein